MFMSHAILRLRSGIFGLCSCSPHLHTPPPFSPSLTSRTVSVDVKHHVYLLTILMVACMLTKSGAVNVYWPISQFSVLLTAFFISGLFASKGHSTNETKPICTVVYKWF